MGHLETSVKISLGLSGW